MEVKICRIRTLFVTGVCWCLKAVWILNGIYRTMKRWGFSGVCGIAYI